MITAYDTVYNLPEISFIAGTDKILNFTAYDYTGHTLQSLWGCILQLKLYHFEEFLDFPELEIDATLVDKNNFYFYLSYTDTLHLDGKYVQKIYTTDFANHMFISASGMITVIPNITG
jgi:hypothetical protein